MCPSRPQTGQVRSAGASTHHASPVVASLELVQASRPLDELVHNPTLSGNPPCHHLGRPLAPGVVSGVVCIRGSPAATRSVFSSNDPDWDYSGCPSWAGIVDLMSDDHL